MEAAVGDMDEPCFSEAVVRDHETVTIYFQDSRMDTRRLVTYARKSVDASWSLEKSVARDVPLPVTVCIVPEDYVSLRHAKTRARFREHLLRKVHDCHKVLGNLLLFKCIVCKNRLVAFHPEHQPAEELSITRTYPNAVAEWHTTPDAARTKAASFHKGTCKRCADSLAKVEADLALKGIATFCAENMMDLLWGLPDVDKPITPDDGKRLA